MLDRRKLGRWGSGSQGHAASRPSPLFTLSWVLAELRESTNYKRPRLRSCRRCGHSGFRQRQRERGVLAVLGLAAAISCVGGLGGMWSYWPRPGKAVDVAVRRGRLSAEHHAATDP